MESSDFLIELLGENVKLSLFVFVVVSVLPKIELGKNLVGE